MCELNWEEDQVYLYNDYLMFIRRKMNCELNLELYEGDLMDIEIDDIKQDKKSNIWKFLCILADKTKKFPESQNSTYIYEAIGFNDWLKMLKRDQRLKELGI
jgi:hypothetical protein